MAARKDMPRKRKAAPKRAAKNTKRPIRREVGAGICAVLTLFTLFSYLNSGGAVGSYTGMILRGLFGWGYYAVAPAFILAMYILIFHRGRPVRACLLGTALLPLLIGAMAHAVAHADINGLEGLWGSGIAMTSGGMLSGLVAVGLISAMEKALTIVILIVLLVIALMLALRLTPADIWNALNAHQRIDYEPEEPKPQKAKHPAKAEPTEAAEPRAIPRAQIDIPLDGEIRAEEKPDRTNGFFAQKSDAVRTPDELLVGVGEPQCVAAPGTVPVPTPDPALAPTLAPQEVTAAPSAPSHIPREELNAVAEEVASEIENELAEEVTEYSYPPITLLEEGGSMGAIGADAEQRNNSRRLEETLRSFGVDAKAGDVIRGPSITRYEFTLEQGVKLSKVTNLADDIALALGASGVRIAPIPEKISVIGIEVPNRQVSAVRLRDVLESREFTTHSSNVAFAVGKDIGGNNIVGNIAKLPHVLIAGTTGSGKSVCTNSLIISLLYRSTPEEVRFIMVDPKMVELAPYNGIPHLLIPVVTDPKKAAGALQWAVFEMMKRYKLFSEHNVKDLAGYNALAEVDDEIKKLPSVVVVIDELADLMLVAAKEVEESICRVAQMGRAAGMHLVIATQRPSADVITGLMKANIPSRIAFAVASSLESRIILDTIGAEKLVGRGDMLYAPLGEGKPRRVQGCLISAEEIERVVNFVKENGETSYSEDVIRQIEANIAEKEKKGAPAAAAEPAADEGDELLPAAIDIVLETGQASVSMLQRRLKLGYSRAARIVDEMEERGIIGPFEGSKPRQLLITREQWQELQMRTQSANEGAVSAESVE